MAQRLAVLLAVASILIIACAADEPAAAYKYEKKSHSKHEKYDKPEHKQYKPDGYKPDGYKPDGYKPDGYKPDGYKPDGYKPDGYPPYGGKPYDPAYPPYGGKPYDPAYPPYGGKPYEPPYGSYEPSYAPGGYYDSTIPGCTACVREYQHTYCYNYDYDRYEITSDFTFCNKHGEGEQPFVGTCYLNVYDEDYQDEVAPNLWYLDYFYGECYFDEKAQALGHPFGENLELYVEGGYYYFSDGVFYSADPESLESSVYYQGGCDSSDNRRSAGSAKHRTPKMLRERLQGKKGVKREPGQARKWPAAHPPHHGAPHNSTRVQSVKTDKSVSTASANYNNYGYVEKKYYEADGYIYYGYIIGVDVTHGMSYKLGVVEFVEEVWDEHVISEYELQGRRLLPEPYSYKFTLIK